MDLSKLSNEELIEIAKQGNEEAKELFFRRNKRLAFHFVNRYGKNVEDAYSIVLEAMVKAYNNFDPSKGVKFTTYFGQMAFGELSRYRRDFGRTLKYSRRIYEIALLIHKNDLVEEDIDVILEYVQPLLNFNATKQDIQDAIHYIYDSHVLSINAPISGLKDDSDDVYFEDTMGVNDDLSNIDIQDILSVLKDKEKKVVLYYKDGYSQVEIGEKLNISQAQVSRLLKAASNKIKEYLKKTQEGENDLMPKINLSEFVYLMERDDIINADIGRFFNLSDGSLYNYIKRYKNGEYKHIKPSFSKESEEKLIKLLENKPKKGRKGIVNKENKQVVAVSKVEDNKNQEEIIEQQVEVKKVEEVKEKINNQEIKNKENIKTNNVKDDNEMKENVALQEEAIFLSQIKHSADKETIARLLTSAITMIQNLPEGEVEISMKVKLKKKID